MNPITKLLSYFADRAILKELDKAQSLNRKITAELEKLKFQRYMPRNIIESADQLLQALLEGVLPGQSVTFTIPLTADNNLPPKVRFDHDGGIFEVDTTELMMKAAAAGVQIKLV